MMKTFKWCGSFIPLPMHIVFRATKAKPQSGLPQHSPQINQYGQNFVTKTHTIVIVM